MVDVGANLGQFTKVALKAGCEVRAFDADVRVRSAWTLTAPLTIVAIGARCQADVPVYSRDKTQESSLYREAVLDTKAEEVSTVSVVRLDAVVQRADLIKVDVQGSESDVLSGAPRLLQTCPAWVIECWPFGLKQAGSSARSLLDQFRDTGFTVTWASGVVVTPDHLEEWLPQCRDVSHVNWLATKVCS